MTPLAEYLKELKPKRKNRRDESALVNACIRWLYAHQVFVWRNNSGGYKSDSGTYVRYGYPGSPDLVGMLPAHSRFPGLFLGVEAKSERGKLSDHQQAFRDRTEHSGGLYIVVRSLDDLEAALKPLLTHAYT